MMSAKDFQNTFAKHLFNYSKGFETDVPDINAGILLSVGERKLRRDFKEELGIK